MTDDAGFEGLTVHLAAGAAGEPTKSAMRRAFRIPLAARATAVVGAVRTLVARLVFDSLAESPSPVLALRGGAPRHLLYEAGPFEIEMSRVEGSLRGSLVPRKEAPAAAGTVALYHGKRRTAGGFMDARGRFAIDGIPPGRYEIRLETGGTVVRVPAVDL